MNVLYIAPMHIILRVFTKKNHCSICRTFMCKIIQMNCRQLFLDITAIASQYFVVNYLRKIFSFDELRINIFYGCAKTRSGIKCCHIWSSTFKQNSFFRFTGNIPARTNTNKCPTAISYRWNQRRWNFCNKQISILIFKSFHRHNRKRQYITIWTYGWNLF